MTKNSSLCFIDTHTHLDIAEMDFRQADMIPSSADRDLQPLLDRARVSGVTKIITISFSLESAYNAVRIIDRYKNIWAIIGVHPDNIDNFSEETISELRLLAQQNKKVVAIGEIGYDFGPHGEKTSVSEQEAAFRAQLNLARKLDLPAVIHTREADELTLRVLQDFTDLKLVVHCYQSGPEMTQAILDNPNWFFSFTGLITFPKRIKHILAVIEKAPLAKIMIETDTPFLAPVPYRGQINEPTFVVEVARKIAEIKKVSLEKVAEITTQNAEAFFRI